MATRDGALLGRHGGIAELAGHRPVAIDHVHQPGRAGVVEEELGVLPGEVLVVEMQPVVRLELGSEHLGIPDLLELDPGVVEHHRHRVVPRRGVGRRVDRHLGRLLERHRVHVAARELAPDLDHLPVVERLGSDAVERRVARRRRIGGQEERAAPVVEEPFGAAAALEQAEREAVGLEVVALGVVHRDQQPGRRGRQPDPAERGRERHEPGRPSREKIAPIQHPTSIIMSAAPRPAPRPAAAVPAAPARSWDR